jgi:hypothetical protein
MDFRFGIWNLRSLYRADSIMTVAKELPKYKLHSVGVQEVRYDRGGTEPAGTFFYGMVNENCGLGTDFFVHKRIICHLHHLLVKLCSYWKWKFG